LALCREQQAMNDAEKRFPPSDLDEQRGRIEQSFIDRQAGIDGQQRALGASLDMPRQPALPWAREATKSSTRDAKRRILVVDDSDLAADSLAMMLALEGYDVHARYHGAAAIEAVDALHPDAAILDIGMPGMNGYEACQQIRQHSHGKSIALIALTGWNEESDIRRTYAAGFDAHIVKPPKPSELRQVLTKLLSQSG
jgi:CheY-like chemotaxis protein